MVVIKKRKSEEPGQGQDQTRKDDDDGDVASLPPSSADPVPTDQTRNCVFPSNRIMMMRPRKGRLLAQNPLPSYVFLAHLFPFFNFTLGRTFFFLSYSFGFALIVLIPRSPSTLSTSNWMGWKNSTISDTTVISTTPRLHRIAVCKQVETWLLVTKDSVVKRHRQYLCLNF